MRHGGTTAPTGVVSIEVGVLDEDYFTHGGVEALEVSYADPMKIPSNLIKTWVFIKPQRAQSMGLAEFRG